MTQEDKQFILQIRKRRERLVINRQLKSIAIRENDSIPDSFEIPIAIKKKKIRIQRISIEQKFQSLSIK